MPPRKHSYQKRPSHGGGIEVPSGFYQTSNSLLKSNAVARGLVGRKFQYVTSGGERKNYMITSYDADTRMHSVQRYNKNNQTLGYKTKEISLEDLPNLRWLDDENENNNKDRRNSSGTKAEPEPSTSRKRKRSSSLKSRSKDKSHSSDSDSRSSSSSNNNNHRGDLYDGIKNRRRASRNSSESAPPEEIEGRNNRRRSSVRSHKDSDSDNSHTRSSIGGGDLYDGIKNRRRTKREVSEIPSSPLSSNSSRNVARRISTSSDSSASLAATAAPSEALHPKGKSSIYTGVTQRRVAPHNPKKWVAQSHRVGFVKSHGSPVIGYYAREIDAARAFDAAMREHGGPEVLHLLNFPTPAERDAIASPRSANNKTNLIPRKYWVTERWPRRPSHHRKRRHPPVWESPVSSPTTRSSKPATEEEPTTNSTRPRKGQRLLAGLETGDRIAFGGKDNEMYFGTLTHRGSNNEAWTVSFDDGKVHHLQRNHVAEGLELYERILEHEALHPVPDASENPEVGHRVAIFFGASGVHFGSVKGSGEDRAREKGQRWTVRFDDGETHFLSTTELKQGMDLYKSIRERRLKSLVKGEERQNDSDDSDGSDQEDENDSGEEDEEEQSKDKTLTEATKKKLLAIEPEKRIAFDFGKAGVYFGRIEEAFTDDKNPEDWKWEVTFDDGDRYEFDALEMAEGIALYEQLWKQEKSDPECKKMVREWKEEYLAEKREVEKKLPRRVKNRFLEVGFARWGKNHLPCLFLGPYDVSPGAVREQWLEAFEKVEEPKDPNSTIPQIVYWFGVATLEKGFSIIDEGDCFTFEQGKELGFYKKRDGSSHNVLKHNKALAMLRVARKKPPEDRPPLGKVREAHERVSGPNKDRLVAEFEAAKKQYRGGSVFLSDT